MKKNLSAALLGAALAAGLPPASAEAVYRCGDSYSQKPCPGGKLVEVDDARSAGQKSQTDMAARRDAQAAAALEKDRLKAEARAAQPAASGATAAAAPRTAPVEPRPAPAGSKPRKPEHFTAVSPRKPGDPPPRKKKKAKKTDA